VKLEKTTLARKAAMKMRARSPPRALRTPENLPGEAPEEAGAWVSGALSLPVMDDFLLRGKGFLFHQKINQITIA
jgi:hypothetical protein